MAKGLLLIDTLNLAHAANNNKALHVGDLPTQAIYGFLRSIRLAMATFPQLKPVCLHDGKSWRYSAFPTYKESRSKPPKTATDIKVAGLREALKKQKPYIVRSMKMLGVTQMFALNLEADDLAAYMVKRAAGRHPIMLLTADKDWVQLVSPTVSWFDPIHDVRLMHGNLSKRLGWSLADKKFIASGKDQTSNFIGVPSARAFLEMKALMGDTSDDIPGVGGIGEKGALELVTEYGSVTDFLNRTIEEPTLKLPKKLADFAASNEKQEIFLRNMRLMDLNHGSVPAPASLTVDHGALDVVKFEEFANSLLFRSITTDLSGWLEPFRPHTLRSAA